MESIKPLESFHILVVDDEPPIFDFLCRIAAKDFPEARLTNTRSAPETLEHLDSHADQPPQLVLLDIDLRAATDGLSLLPELRGRFKGRVPIIMLSYLDEEAKIEQAYEQGAVAYTQKPEDMEGWHEYVSMLRDYWHRSARLPGVSPPTN
ncbi:response regulator [Spirosoma sp. BT702]|uniref:Response regulator n=1 Tax=Spirosoma profusum TaxID=2771354 RepID=A0A926XYW0_9BACT|nr:response regulator [Spirosoma profusum]MBD2703327.1 response regulator [Spirosoma profusum]